MMRRKNRLNTALRDGSTSRQGAVFVDHLQGSGWPCRAAPKRFLKWRHGRLVLMRFSQLEVGTEMLREGAQLPLLRGAMGPYLPPYN
jgi:hypothetical protein